jgi:hypothetical protein
VSTSFRRPGRAAIFALIALTVATLVAASSLRERILRGVGWALVATEPVAPADIIVVSLDSGGAGALEAADLVQAGIAKRVAVFSDPPSGDDLEFIRRGIPFDDWGARQVRQLGWLGVKDVAQISRAGAGTKNIAQLLQPWFDQHQIRSFVFVTTRDRSRRLQRVLAREMGQAMQVTVRPSRYSTYDPDRWWQTRDGIRALLVELQRLMLDVVRHPTSP